MSKKHRTAKGGFSPSGGGPAKAIGRCWVTGKPLDDGGIRIGLREIAEDKSGKAIVERVGDQDIPKLTGNFKIVHVSTSMAGALPLCNPRWAWDDGHYYKLA